MADQRRDPEDDRSRTAVVDAKAVSATEDYARKETELHREEGRLADLQQRHARGERLTSAERLDRLDLPETITLLKQERDALQGPMDAEQLQCDIADLTAVRNRLAPGMAQAFERWVSSLNIAYMETQALRAVVHNYGVELSRQPTYHPLGEAAPDADALMTEMLKKLPEGSLLTAPVTMLHTKEMFAIFTPAHHHEERHLADRVARRRSR